MTAGRDDALITLPPVNNPYRVDKLSAAETAALEEALSDGFGCRSVVGEYVAGAGAAVGHFTTAVFACFASYPPTRWSDTP
jgi:hypothetical protein